MWTGIGKKGAWGWERGLQIRELTRSMGQASVEVRSFVQKPPVQVRRLSFYIYKHHTCNNIMYLLAILYILRNIYSLFCRLKINHMMEIWNMRLFFAKWTVWLQTRTTSSMYNMNDNQVNQTSEHSVFEDPIWNISLYITLQ